MLACTSHPLGEPLAWRDVACYAHLKDRSPTRGEQHFSAALKRATSRVNCHPERSPPLSYSKGRAQSRDLGFRKTTLSSPAQIERMRKPVEEQRLCSSGCSCLLDC